MEVHERIKNRRLELGLSADDVAEALNISRATVYRYESAAIEKLPTSILGPLSHVLRCTPAYLMGWAEKPDGHPTERTEIETDDPTINRLLACMLLLNDAGREKLLERAEELKEVPKYGTRSSEEEKRWQ